MTESADVLVVGAGFAGLAAGLDLRAAGFEVRVLEREATAGGVARSERIGGYLVERGPNTVRPKLPMMEFLERHGLATLLEPARPASRLRFLVHQGRLEPVPMNPVAFARTPLLSARGKLRLLSEPLRRGGDPSGESVAAFVERRLGAEALERLVAPFLTGIYAGDERQLGAEAVFPSLVEAERLSGSIVRGLLRASLGRRGPRPPRGTWSAALGLGSLATAQAERLGASLELESPVQRLEKAGGGFLAEIEAPGGRRRLRADKLVLALPAHESARLLASLDAELARELESLAYAPVASLSLGIALHDLERPPRGFGFLVPPGEASGSPLLGCLFMSSLFPGRAPEGHALVTALLGGARHPEALESSDEALEGHVRAALERLLGLRGKPERLAITRWKHAVAQPGPDHPGRLGRIRERLAHHPGLALAGAYLDGVAVADAVASGAEAARALLRGPAGSLCAAR